MSATLIQPYHGSYLMPSIEHARVTDVMHPGVLACEPDAPLTEVARIMATRHVHCIAVMGVSHDGGEHLAWSLVSDRDVMRAALAGGAEPTAGALAHSPVVAVSPETPLREAAALLLEREVSHALVIDPAVQHPMGLLSTLDVIGSIAWGEA